ncbi:hypothetical protein GIX45_20110 [Erwinia sp. CPCC 100877]|nr:hypothetical protein [Erwinia sp. CPCC 100877]
MYGDGITDFLIGNVIIEFMLIVVYAKYEGLCLLFMEYSGEFRNGVQVFRMIKLIWGLSRPERENGVSH